ncbi:UNVERIFIED_CONTAM: hypothetical protein PYX00_000984 [Menopon gallinae]|uniref:Uncharacterized protein n=1 Tax=Menopon gallinae TaxID=328185 RepID=A0AAW2IB28_9NEOP
MVDSTGHSGKVQGKWLGFTDAAADDLRESAVKGVGMLSQTYDLEARQFWTTERRLGKMRRLRVRKLNHLSAVLVVYLREEGYWLKLVIRYRIAEADWSVGVEEPEVQFGRLDMNRPNLHQGSTITPLFWVSRHG